MMKKIVVTGSDGRFAQELKKIKSKYNFIFRNKKQLNILSLKSINRNVKNFKPNYILHLAGLSRPMSIHEKQINKSIDLNIIGTCNLVKTCNEKKIKLIFFPQVIFILAEKVIIKKQIQFYLGITMAGLSSALNQLFRCTLTH